MDPTKLINQSVEVIACYRKNCMPVKMKHKNQIIIFSELGLKHPTMKGQRMVHVFDMSDGLNDYRLEFDAESLTWTLVAMIEKQNAEY